MYFVSYQTETEQFIQYFLPVKFFIMHSTPLGLNVLVTLKETNFEYIILCG